MVYLKTFRKSSGNYYAIAESYRVPGEPNPKTRTICNLGKVEDILELVELRRRIAEDPGRAIDDEAIRSRFDAIELMLDERMRRLWAAAEAKIIGRGGITLVANATGISDRAIRSGIRELEGGPSALDDGSKRTRRAGGGRKKAQERDPTLVEDLNRLIEPTERGDPESPLRWTIKSLRKLAAELEEMDHQVSHATVGNLLVEMGYSLQANRKTLEGTQHKDRNAQFEYINAKVEQEQIAGNPVVSIDCKKKENIGLYKIKGQTWRPKGDPEKVKVHDFPDKKLGKAIPFGVYDLLRNEGWVSVGIDHETSTFAVETIRRWWYSMGRYAYPDPDRLRITADCGGSNGNRRKLWKVELQKLADELGFPICLNHLPPATSKWNKIEHRMFSYITKNWEGIPLTSLEVVINHIGSTTTSGGLTIHCELDENKYPTGIEVTDEQLSVVNLKGDEFHPEWNYTISPN